jgi:hypothetical protein
VEDADRLSRPQERHPEKGLDALVTPDRVPDVGGVDVVEDDRRARRGDAAREAAADGNANSLLDLLLDPEGRTGDELVSFAVEQEHGAHVGSEDLLDPREEHAEQLVGLEIPRAASVTA